MGSAVYCPTCAVKVNPNRVRCMICATVIPNQTRKNPLYSKVDTVLKKAAVFDIDDTILNPKQRFIDARRAGLVDNTGKPIAKGLTSMGKAWKKRNDFLYSNKQLAKDKPIPGVKGLLNKLEREGYVIIYLTARPMAYQDSTIKQLEDNNFPLHKSDTGGVLVFSRTGNLKTPEFKKQALANIQSRYQLEMFFDDSMDNLSAARELGIPGLYTSIKDYSGFEAKSNPHHQPKDFAVETRGGFRVSSEKKEPSVDEAADLLAEAMDRRDAESEIWVGEMPEELRYGTADDEEEEEVEETVQQTLPENPKRNPITKPRKKKMSNGKYRKMNAQDYLNFLMFRDGKMQEEFPNTKQRYAVALGQVEKHYGKSARDRVAYKGNPRKNPQVTVDKAKKMYKSFNNEEPEKIEKKKIDTGKHWVKLGPVWQIGYMNGKEEGNDSQKYIHTFNEESKNGDFPTAWYAPDADEKTIIIRGGSWKIATADGNNPKAGDLSWIVD